MFIRELTTNIASVRLIAPDPARDAPGAVTWLMGEPGRCTLRLMGVSDTDNQPTTLERETRRLHEFLESPDQYNWMIELDGKVVGAVWVELKPGAEIPAPAISIMIGDPSARGHGAGRAAMAAVIEFLREQNHTKIYSRHLTDNTSSAALLAKLGFSPDGPIYTSPLDGYQWQNLVLES